MNTKQLIRAFKDLGLFANSDTAIAAIHVVGSAAEAEIEAANHASVDELKDEVIYLRDRISELRHELNQIKMS